MKGALTSAEVVEAASWTRPDFRLVPTPHQQAFVARCNALQAVLGGQSVRLASRDHKVNRTTLSQTLEKAFERGADSRCHGFRACLPYGIRSRAPLSTPKIGPMTGKPYALGHLFAQFPPVRTLLESYAHPLPPGKPPSSFGRLLADVRRFLREAAADEQWPLNQPDKGRRAFTRYVRSYRRTQLAQADLYERTAPRPAVTSISRIIQPLPFDRFEFDAHYQDVKHCIARLNNKGEIVIEEVSKVWLLIVIDVGSKAVMAWKLVYGQAYSALDVAQCFSLVFQNWEPKQLTVTDLQYPPGAMMPQALSRGVQTCTLLAMDNAKAHMAKLPLATWVAEILGVLNLGRPHVPEMRPTVEGFFKHFEAGAIRFLPGGFEPTRQLGKKAARTSTARSTDHLLDVEGMEQLFDVLVSSYNATPQPALQQRSPLDVLHAFQTNPNRWLPPPRQAHHLRALTTQCKSYRVTGGRGSGKPPHVHCMGVVYRNPVLDRTPEYLGSSVLFMVDLDDLRSIIMVDEKLEEVLTLYAVGPWRLTQHDLTTRRRILRLVRSGQLEILGAQDAIIAYTAFTSRAATKKRGASDELVRMQQLEAKGLLGSIPDREKTKSATTLKEEVPRQGRVSFGHTKDR